MATSTVSGAHARAPLFRLVLAAAFALAGLAGTAPARAAWPAGEPWLVAWYDVADRASVQTDASGRASAWRDLSGNGHHALQPDPERRPLHRASDARLDGLPSLSPAAGRGHSGFELPQMTYRRVYASVQYGAGTEARFAGGGFPTLLSGDGPAGGRRVSGHLGQGRLFDRHTAFDMTPRVNGVSSATVLPLPLSTLVLDAGEPVVQATWLGHLPAMPPSWRWTGPYRRFLFTDGSETAAEARRLERWVAERDGRDPDALPAPAATAPARPAASGAATPTAAAAPVAAAPSGADPRPVPGLAPDARGYVLHLIGQSNATGREPLPSGRTNAVGMVLPDGRLATDANVPMDAPGYYGVDRVLAETWKDTASPILLKTGQAGVTASLYASRFFPRHLERIAALEAPSRYEHVALWVQGESDALLGGGIGEWYRESEGAIFDALREAVPGIRIYSVLLNPAWNHRGDVNLGAGIEAVNRAKRQNAAERPWVETMGGYYSLRPDHIHYDRLGFEQMAWDLRIRLSGP